MGPIFRSKLRLGIVAASASEWRFVGSLVLAATSEERRLSQMPGACSGDVYLAGTSLQTLSANSYFSPESPVACLGSVRRMVRDR